MRMVDDEGKAFEDAGLARRGALLEVNVRIREAALRLDAAEPEAVWAFLCECGEAGCHAQVRLTLAEYDALKAAERPVLAPGHAASRAAVARRYAEALREDATALRAQAEQQLRRARKRHQRR
jgi:hypothetical protein